MTATKQDLLKDILTQLDRGDAPDAKHPDRKGEYWALCPFHPDQHATNFSVSERGYKCHACGEGGSLVKLAKHLGVRRFDGSQRGNRKNILSLTLEEYARVKKLPVDFLKGLGLANIKKSGNPAIKIPYYDLASTEVAMRYRLAFAGKDEFRWRKGDQTYPYGLWKLKEAEKAGYVILIEGESDSHTLWHHGLPALGVPGAAVWKKAWAQYVQGLKVYVWQEPDGGGAEFIERVGKSLPDMLVITPPQGRKDISECHMLDDDVPAVMQSLVAGATPYKAILAAAKIEAAAEAKEQAGALPSCPDILEAFASLCKNMGLVGEKRNAKLVYLAMTSRLLERIISIVMKGPSAAGKSHVVKNVLRAFPDGAFYALSSMSEKALIYDEEPLRHRMLIIYEAAGFASDFGTYIMRSLLSEGHLAYVTVEKTKEGLRSRLIEREGPTGLITTTTWASLHHEIETRLLSLTVRDDRDQTRGIMCSLADKANDDEGIEVDTTDWQAFQTWLELAGDREVFIPYASELAVQSDPSAVRLRRDFGAVLSLIKAHAVLHQENRNRRKDGRIVADLEDYRVIYDLIGDLINESARATVRQEIRETVEAVETLWNASSSGTDVTKAKVGKCLGIGKSAAWTRVAVALKEGYIVNMETGKGRPAQLKLGDSLPAEKSVLPHPDDLKGKEENKSLLYPPQEPSNHRTGEPMARVPIAVPANEPPPLDLGGII